MHQATVHIKILPKYKKNRNHIFILTRQNENKIKNTYFHEDNFETLRTEKMYSYLWLIRLSFSLFLAKENSLHKYISNRNNYRSFYKNSNGT